VKKITFKVFAPGNQQRKEIVIRAPKGKTFTAQGIEALQHEMAARVEQSFPEHDYRFVPIGADAFNFVHEDECGKCKADLGLIGSVA
jgi:hypothetical protein